MATYVNKSGKNDSFYQGYADSLGNLTWDDLVSRYNTGLESSPGYLRDINSDRMVNSQYTDPTYGYLSGNYLDQENGDASFRGAGLLDNFTHVDPTYGGGLGGDRLASLSRGEDGGVNVTELQKNTNETAFAKWVALAASMGLASSAFAGAGTGSAGAGAGAGAGDAALNAALFEVAPAMTEAEIAAMIQGGSDLALSGASADLAAAGYGAAGAGAGVGAGSGAAPTAGTPPSTPPPTGPTIPDVLKNPLVQKALVAGVGGLLGGSDGGSGSGGDSQTSTRQDQIDPRMGGLLYGPDGKSGLLNQIAGQANAPQSGGLLQFGNAANEMLGNNGAGMMSSIFDTAGKLQKSNIQAPSMAAAQSASPQGANLHTMQAAQGNAPSNMQASQINAPGQNRANLMPAYEDMIYGDPGANPFLTGGIAKGINQSNTAFQNMQTDATRNLLENILPNIRSGAIANGQMGGSRQAIAESRALNDFSTQSQRAAAQVAQQNTDAAVAAQAGAYNVDRSNALSAMSGLSGQQYGTASNNAQLQQQAGTTNYQGNLAMNQANLGYANQAANNNAQMANQNSQFNSAANTQNNQFNANSQNAAAQNNGGWQNNTNVLNSSNQQNGMAGMSNALNGMYTFGTNQDQYGLNRLRGVSGALQPFTGLGGTTTSSQPLYENKAGNIIGGAVTGLGLLNAYNKFNES